MRVEERAETIARELHAIGWTWQRRDVDELVSRFNVTLVERVNGRETYSYPGGILLDVYTNVNAIESIEIELESFDDVEELDDDEYEEKVDEYFGKFETVVDAVGHVLGRPVFNNGFGTRGFPSDQDAVWLALWRFDGARFMVQQRNEGRDMPFRISIVVAPVK
jgi:hypothetical protein